VKLRENTLNTCASWACGCLLTAFAVFFGILAWDRIAQRQWEARFRDHLRLRPDYGRVNAVEEAMEGAYDEAGRVYRRLADLQRSAYCPYGDIDYNKCYVMTGVFDVLVEGEASRPRRRIVVRSPGRTSTLYVGPFLQWHGPRERTMLMVVSYTRGLAGRARAIEKVRARFLKMDRGSGCPWGWHRRPIPRPLSARDVPRSASELRAYEKWVAECEGVDELVDAWGHTLRFSLAGGGVRCQSAGPDGEWGTKDDIVAIGGILQ
jgi:hypothetical protein